MTERPLQSTPRLVTWCLETCRPPRCTSELVTYLELEGTASHTPERGETKLHQGMGLQGIVTEKANLSQFDAFYGFIDSPTVTPT